MADTYYDASLVVAQYSELPEVPKEAGRVILVRDANITAAYYDLPDPSDSSTIVRHPLVPGSTWEAI